MSIVNNASSGSQINLLCLISNFIHRNPNKYSYEELLDECRPKSLLWLDDHEKRFRGDFKFWEKNDPKLWETDENNKYFLSSFNGEHLGLEDIAKLVREKLFFNIDKDFLNTDNKELAPIFRILSVLNLVNNFSPIVGRELNKSSLDEFLKNVFPKYQLNDSEKTYFLKWGHFLGFLEVQSRDSYVVDPFQVVLSVLPEIFKKSERMSIKDFLTALGEKLPVLGFGYYSKNVQKNINEHLDEDLLGLNIPSPLSQALTRLSIMGTLKLIPLSDDKDAMKLILPNHDEFKSIVQYNKEG